MQAVSTRTRVTYAVCFALVLLLAFAAFFLVARHVGAQTIDLSQSTRPAAKGHVQFAAEPQTIAANKPATVLLHFHVDSGFHINSHTPKSEMLIATKIAIGEGEGIKVQTVDFPAGQPYSFSFEPQTKLDVYTGDVVLTAHVVAQPGQRNLIGVLRYQACDQAACYPPKTLPVEQPFTAR
jgi:uncharacterized ParB-like nuclease family protein